MSTPVNLLQNPAHSATNLQAQKVEMAQQEIKGLGQTKMTSAEKAAKLRETCESFESIFIQKMWQQMRATLPQENPLVGREEKFWQSMYDQEFSKKMSEGGGIGLADMMYEQLSENLHNVSKTTAGAYAQGKAFEINAAPMLPSQTSVQVAGQKAGGTDLKVQENAMKAHDVAKVAPAAVATTAVAAKPEKFNALYEEMSPQGAEKGSDVGAAQNSGQSTTAVQQFLAQLQAKQGGTASMTGPERAAHVQQVVGNAPPPSGVLPPSAAPTKVTYTTNIPKGQRSGDAETHMRDLMAKAAMQPRVGQQPWAQATAGQQAESAVQDALRQAHENVAKTVPSQIGASQTTTGQTASVAKPVVPTAPLAPVQPPVSPIPAVSTAPAAPVTSATLGAPLASAAVGPVVSSVVGPVANSGANPVSSGLIAPLNAPIDASGEPMHGAAPVKGKQTLSSYSGAAPSRGFGLEGRRG